MAQFKEVSEQDAAIHLGQAPRSPVVNISNFKNKSVKGKEIVLGNGYRHWVTDNIPIAGSTDLYNTSVLVAIDVFNKEPTIFRSRTGTVLFNRIKVSDLIKDIRWGTRIGPNGITVADTNTFSPYGFMWEGAKSKTVDDSILYNATADHHIDGLNMIRNGTVGSYREKAITGSLSVFNEYDNLGYLQFATNYSFILNDIQLVRQDATSVASGETHCIISVDINFVIVERFAQQFYDNATAARIVIGSAPSKALPKFDPQAGFRFTADSVGFDSSFAKFFLSSQYAPVGVGVSPNPYRSSSKARPQVKLVSMKGVILDIVIPDDIIGRHQSSWTRHIIYDGVTASDVMSNIDMTPGHASVFTGTLLRDDRVHHVALFGKGNPFSILLESDNEANSNMRYTSFFPTQTEPSDSFCAYQSASNIEVLIKKGSGLLKRLKYNTTTAAWDTISISLFPKLESRREFVVPDSDITSITASNALPIFSSNYADRTDGAIGAIGSGSFGDTRHYAKFKLVDGGVQRNTVVFETGRWNDPDNLNDSRIIPANGWQGNKDDNRLTVSSIEKFVGTSLLHQDIVISPRGNELYSFVTISGLVDTTYDTMLANDNANSSVLWINSSGYSADYIDIATTDTNFAFAAERIYNAPQPESSLPSSNSSNVQKVERRPVIHVRWKYRSLTVTLTGPVIRTRNGKQFFEFTAAFDPVIYTDTRFTNIIEGHSQRRMHPTYLIPYAKQWRVFATDSAGTVVSAPPSLLKRSTTNPTAFIFELPQLVMTAVLSKGSSATQAFDVFVVGFDRDGIAWGTELSATLDTRPLDVGDVTLLFKGIEYKAGPDTTSAVVPSGVIVTTVKELTDNAMTLKGSNVIANVTRTIIHYEADNWNDGYGGKPGARSTILGREISKRSENRMFFAVNSNTEGHFDKDISSVFLQWVERFPRNAQTNIIGTLAANPNQAKDYTGWTLHHPTDDDMFSSDVVNDTTLSHSQTASGADGLRFGMKLTVVGHLGNTATFSLPIIHFTDQHRFIVAPPAISSEGPHFIEIDKTSDDTFNKEVKSLESFISSDTDTTDNHIISMNFRAAPNYTTEDGKYTLFYENSDSVFEPSGRLSTPKIAQWWVFGVPFDDKFIDTGGFVVPRSIDAQSEKRSDIYSKTGTQENYVNSTHATYINRAETIVTNVDDRFLGNWVYASGVNSIGSGHMDFNNLIFTHRTVLNAAPVVLTSGIVPNNRYALFFIAKDQNDQWTAIDLIHLDSKRRALGHPVSGADFNY